MPISLGAATAIGAGAQFAGQLFANASNKELAREQMEFQERMSNTQYQRAAKDLEAAGLNRILALGSPASTPQGARPNIQNPTEGAAGITSAAGLINAQKKLINENINVAQNQAKALVGQYWNQFTQSYSNAKDVQRKHLENSILGMREKIWRDNPSMLKASMQASPIQVGMSSARDALDAIMRGTWK